jgi:hypothetical protein
MNARDVLVTPLAVTFRSDWLVVGMTMTINYHPPRHHTHPPAVGLTEVIAWLVLTSSARCAWGVPPPAVAGTGRGARRKAAPRPRNTAAHHGISGAGSSQGEQV